MGSLMQQGSDVAPMAISTRYLESFLDEDFILKFLENIS